MWNRPAYRRLIWALLLSVLAHWALLGRLPAWLGSEDDESAVSIEVALVAPRPPARPAPAAAQAPAPPVSPVAQPQPLPPTASMDVPEEAASPLPETLPVPTAQPVPSAEQPAPVAVPMTEPPSVQAAAASEASTYVMPEEEVTAPPPRHVEIDYRLLRKGSNVGVERHRYQAREDGSYSLSSVAEPKGLLALALSELVQKSEGRVTEHGLQPSTFLYQYGSNADKAQLATFDWQTGQLNLRSGARSQAVPLHEGAQDLMSFMYQFMFIPPLQEMRIAITNGKRLKTYDYGFEGEETLETAMGALRCIHIGRTSSDEEKTEIWLAADYHYLPVKISKTEKDGTVTERIATRLQIE